MAGRILRAAVIAMALGALVSSSALADEGELHIDATAEIEAAWLRHPRAMASLSFDTSTAFAVIPRISVGARAGLTNELHIGAAIALGGTPNVVTNGVTLGGVDGQLVSGSYLAATTQLSLSWRFDSGYDVSTVARIDVGPSLALWTGNALVDPRRLDADGRPALLPFEVKNSLQPGAFVATSLAVDWRFVDAFAIGVRPYAVFAWTGSPEIHAGIALTPSFVAALFPL